MAEDLDDFADAVDDAKTVDDGPTPSPEELVSREHTFENQRYATFYGWVDGNLSVEDPPKWSPVAGKGKVAYHPERSSKLPAGWCWVTEWKLDKRSRPCDPDGWYFGLDFEDIKTDGTKAKGMSSYVRRRKWTRVRFKGKKEDYVPRGDNRFESGFKKGPLEGGYCCWSIPSATTFNVRGPNYLEDRIKAPSCEAIFETIGCDMFQAPKAAIFNVAARSDSPMMKARAAGDKRFYFVFNWQCDGLHAVFYFAERDDHPALKNAGFKKMYTKFFEGDDNDFRDNRLKVVPSIVEGPWVVKQAVGQKPAIVGNKMDTKYVKGDNYFEVDADVYSTTLTTMVMGVLKGYCDQFAIDVGFLIESQENVSLPERVLGAIRVTKCDITMAVRQLKDMPMPDEDSK